MTRPLKLLSNYIRTEIYLISSKKGGGVTPVLARHLHTIVPFRVTLFSKLLSPTAADREPANYSRRTVPALRKKKIKKNPGPHQAAQRPVEEEDRIGSDEDIT